MIERAHSAWPVGEGGEGAPEPSDGAMIRVRDIVQKRENGRRSVVYDLETAGTCHRVFVEGLPGQSVPDHVLVDSALLLFLLPAMRERAKLVLPGAPSTSVAAAVPKLQEIYSTWYPEVFSETEIVAPRPENGELGNGGAEYAFFSGGVDSFWLLHARGAPADGLLFVEGLDIPLKAALELDAVRQSFQGLEQDAGVRIHFLRTNLRDFTDPRADWGKAQHGLAMAAIAHLLIGNGGVVRMASSYTWRELQPWGESPLTASLLTGASVRLELDGLSVSRLERVASLAESPVASRYLRVCWASRGAFNCGECEKCQRTAAALRAVGAADAFTTVPRCDVQRIRELSLTTEQMVGQWREIRAAARRNGDHRLAEAIDVPLSKWAAARVLELSGCRAEVGRLLAKDAGVVEVLMEETAALHPAAAVRAAAAGVVRAVKRRVGRALTRAKAPFGKVPGRKQG